MKDVACNWGTDTAGVNEDDGICGTVGGAIEGGFSAREEEGSKLEVAATLGAERDRDPGPNDTG